MSGLLRSLLAFLRQVLWALLLVYIILLGIAYLFGRQIGFELSFWVCSGIALLVTASFVAVYICSVVWVAIEEALRQRSFNRSKKRE